jgi:hypothetical protein
VSRVIQQCVKDGDVGREEEAWRASETIATKIRQEKVKDKPEVIPSARDEVLRAINKQTEECKYQIVTRLQNGKLSGCRLEALARAPGNQLSPLLERRSKIIPDGMISVQTVRRLPRGLDLYVWYTL